MASMELGAVMQYFHWEEEEEEEEEEEGLLNVNISCGGRAYISNLVCLAITSHCSTQIQYKTRQCCPLTRQIVRQSYTQTSYITDIYIVYTGNGALLLLNNFQLWISENIYNSLLMSKSFPATDLSIMCWS